MKILAFSDLHRDQTAAQMIVDASSVADVVIGAGDFATRREGALDTLSILKNCAAPVILVHGNHDDPDEISQFCLGWENGHYLHGSSVVIEGQSFFGLGGEIPSRNSNSWNASETEKEATSHLKLCSDSAVFITHTPPLGVADLQKTGEHEGSAAIHEAVSSHQPILLLCGHIHHAWGTTGSVGSTRVHNLGPTVNWYEI